jgi:peptidoglycan/xylan/chitin deacetylase (PgdA/CDA1 family)
MATGLPSLVSKGSNASLLVLNYHRIWAPGQQSSEFDDGVFDADFETFRRQMEWLSASTHVLDESGVLSLANRQVFPRGKLYTLVTFDDGYAECYSLVKPVLDSLGIRGIFFIPVALLEYRRLGWWDLAAYVLKKSGKLEIRVRETTFRLGRNLPVTLRHILNLFKLEKVELTEGLLKELSEACGVALPDKDRQSAELMGWDQVCKLQRAGHSIGSHAKTHRVLATLTPAEQAKEIKESRRELKSIVGADIASFAYPVGGRQHYDTRSIALVKEAGYEQAFTFNSGVSSLPITDNFQIPRESAKSFTTLKAKVLMPRFMGLRRRGAA